MLITPQLKKKKNQQSGHCKQKQLINTTFQNSIYFKICIPPLLLAYLWLLPSVFTNPGLFIHLRNSVYIILPFFLPILFSLWSFWISLISLSLFSDVPLFLPSPSFLLLLLGFPLFSFFFFAFASLCYFFPPYFLPSLPYLLLSIFTHFFFIELSMKWV